MEEILIDEKTRMMLLDCDRTMAIANQRLQDICRVLFNLNNIDIINEKWQLSEDRSKLLKDKEV